jgi:hypothetical protein
MPRIVRFGAYAREDFGRYAHGRVGQEPMSFRTRLTSFFVLIVVVPMIAVGFLVFRLIDDSVQGRPTRALPVWRPRWRVCMRVRAPWRAQTPRPWRAIHRC